MDINMCSFYNGIRYVVQLKLLILREGLQVIEGSAYFLPSWYHPGKASYKTLFFALRSVPYTSNEIPWIVVLSMHETHCKHCSLIPLLVFNNSLGLLRCGCMCAGTLLHIPRHMGRMSNNNKILKMEIYDLFVLN